MAKAHIPDGVKKLIKDRSKNPSQGEFLAEIIALAGGAKQLAVHLWGEYTREGASPMFKARFMDTVMRAMAAEDKKNRPQDLAELSDADIEEVIRGVMEKKQKEDGDGPADQS